MNYLHQTSKPNKFNTYKVNLQTKNAIFFTFWNHIQIYELVLNFFFSHWHSSTHVLLFLKTNFLKCSTPWFLYSVRIASWKSHPCPHEETLHPWLSKMYSLKILIEPQICRLIWILTGHVWCAMWEKGPYTICGQHRSSATDLSIFCSSTYTTVSINSVSEQQRP